MPGSGGSRGGGTPWRRPRGPGAASPPGSDAAAAAWEEYGRRRYADNRSLVESFATWLRPGLDVDRATDVFWAVFDHGTIDALMRQRGWSVEDHADWLIDSFSLLVLDDAKPGRRPHLGDGG